MAQRGFTPDNRLMSGACANAATELSDLAETLGDLPLREAFRRCSRPRVSCLIAEAAPQPFWFNELGASFERVALCKLFLHRDLALRAGKVILILGSEATLNSDTLDLVQWLRQCRPSQTTFAIFTSQQVIDGATLSRLERRAWRTLLASPPAITGITPLEDYKILVDDADPGRQLQNKKTMSLWLAEPEAPSSVCDRLAMMPLLRQLDDEIVRAKSIALHDRACQARIARDLHATLRDRLRDLIDAAYDEIETAIINETRVAGRAMSTAITEAAENYTSALTFSAILAKNTLAIKIRLEDLIKAVESDLKEAIVDNLADVPPSIKAVAKNTILRMPLFADIKVSFLEAASVVETNSQADLPSRMDTFLAFFTIVAASLLPSSSRRFFPIRVLSETLGPYYAPRIRALISKAFQDIPDYEALARLTNEQIQQGTVRLRETLVRLRGEAIQRIDRELINALNDGLGPPVDQNHIAMRRRLDEISALFTDS